MNSKITCKTCSKENVPDWNGKGQCITCSRNEVMNSKLREQPMSNNTQELRERIEEIVELAIELGRFWQAHDDGVKPPLFVTDLKGEPHITREEAENRILSLIKSQTNQAVLEALDRVDTEVIGAAKVDDNPRGDEFIGIELSTIAVMTRRQRQKLATLRQELTQEVQTDE